MLLRNGTCCCAPSGVAASAALSAANECAVVGIRASSTRDTSPRAALGSLATREPARQSRPLSLAQACLGKHMKVGFVGLGRMGQGMARRLLDAGHDLWVFDSVRGAGRAAGRCGRARGSVGRRARDAQRRRRDDARGGRRRDRRRARTRRSLRIAAERRDPSRDGHARRRHRARSSRLGIARQAKRSSRRPCSAGRISPPPGSSASSSAGPQMRSTRCNELLQVDGPAHLRRGRQNRSQPRPSSSRTTRCSAARWSRWPKASRSCASTT